MEHNIARFLTENLAIGEPQHIAFEAADHASAASLVLARGGRVWVPHEATALHVLELQGVPHSRAAELLATAVEG